MFNKEKNKYKINFEVDLDETEKVFDIFMKYVSIMNETKYEKNGRNEGFSLKMARNKDQHLIGLFNHFLGLKEAKELINTINDKYNELFYSYNEEVETKPTQSEQTKLVRKAKEVKPTQSEQAKLVRKAKKEVKNPNTTQSEQAKLVRKELLEKGTQKTLKIVEEEKPFVLLKKVKS